MSSLLLVTGILNKNAPLKTKTVRPKSFAHWLTSALSINLIQFAVVLKKSRNVRILVTISNSFIFIATNRFHASVITAKRLYNSSVISSKLFNPGQLKILEIVYFIVIQL
jgi:hypothetical protein